ncbi:hypothetical protein COBT_001381 [Conglomerata obtusa]
MQLLLVSVKNIISTQNFDKTTNINAKTLGHQSSGIVSDNYMRNDLLALRNRVNTNLDINKEKRDVNVSWDNTKKVDRAIGLYYRLKTLRKIKRISKSFRNKKIASKDKKPLRTKMHIDKCDKIFNKGEKINNEDNLCAIIPPVKDKNKKISSDETGFKKHDNLLTKTDADALNAERCLCTLRSKVNGIQACIYCKDALPINSECKNNPHFKLVRLTKPLKIEKNKTSRMKKMGKHKGNRNIECRQMQCKINLNETDKIYNALKIVSNKETKKLNYFVVHKLPNLNAEMPITTTKDKNKRTKNVKKIENKKFLNFIFNDIDHLSLAISSKHEAQPKEPKKTENKVYNDCIKSNRKQRKCKNQSFVKVKDKLLQQNNTLYQKLTNKPIIADQTHQNRYLINDGTEDTINSKVYLSPKNVNFLAAKSCKKVSILAMIQPTIAVYDKKSILVPNKCMSTITTITCAESVSANTQTNSLSQPIDVAQVFEYNKNKLVHPVEDPLPQLTCVLDLDDRKLEQEKCKIQAKNKDVEDCESQKIGKIGTICEEHVYNSEPQQPNFYGDSIIKSDNMNEKIQDRTHKPHALEQKLNICSTKNEHVIKPVVVDTSELVKTILDTVVLGSCDAENVIETFRIFKNEKLNINQNNANTIANFEKPTVNVKCNTEPHKKLQNQNVLINDKFSIENKTTKEKFLDEPQNSLIHAKTAKCIQSSEILNQLNERALSFLDFNRYIYNNPKSPKNVIINVQSSNPNFKLPYTQRTTIIESFVLDTYELVCNRDIQKFAKENNRSQNDKSIFQLVMCHTQSIEIDHFYIYMIHRLFYYISKSSDYDFAKSYVKDKYFNTINYYKIYIPAQMNVLSEENINNVVNVNFNAYNYARSKYTSTHVFDANNCMDDQIIIRKEKNFNVQLFIFDIQKYQSYIKFCDILEATLLQCKNTKNKKQIYNYIIRGAQIDKNIKIDYNKHEIHCHDNQCNSKNQICLGMCDNCFKVNFSSLLIEYEPTKHKISIKQKYAPLFCLMQNLLKIIFTLINDKYIKCNNFMQKFFYFVWHENCSYNVKKENVYFTRLYFYHTFLQYIDKIDLYILTHKNTPLSLINIALNHESSDNKVVRNLRSIISNFEHDLNLIIRLFYIPPSLDKIYEKIILQNCEFKSLHSYYEYTLLKNNFVFLIYDLLNFNIKIKVSDTIQYLWLNSSNEINVTNFADTIKYLQHVLHIFQNVNIFFKFCDDILTENIVFSSILKSHYHLYDEYKDSNDQLKCMLHCYITKPKFAMAVFKEYLKSINN